LLRILHGVPDPLYGDEGIFGIQPIAELPKVLLKGDQLGSQRVGIRIGLQPELALLEFLEGVREAVFQLREGILVRVVGFQKELENIPEKAELPEQPVVQVRTLLKRQLGHLGILELHDQKLRRFITCG
jgi:hypothetical protein